MKPEHDEPINWENVEHPFSYLIHDNKAIQYELMQEKDFLQKLANLEFVSVDEDTKEDLRVQYAYQLERIRLNIQQLESKAA